jgi:hypothetical protein|mmetsp:Transcript_39361/g.65383  ORF Transcript_39361/g.65383 Transcript_39361/m.65383 type:complete len:148 (-) Transcript_39361:1144-1587(-)
MECGQNVNCTFSSANQSEVFLGMGFRIGPLQESLADNANVVWQPEAPHLACPRGNTRAATAVFAYLDQNTPLGLTQPAGAGADQALIHFQHMEVKIKCHRQMQFHGAIFEDILLYIKDLGLGNAHPTGLCNPFRNVWMPMPAQEYCN